MAGPIQAKAAAKEAGELTAAAAEELFDVVRMRVLQGEAFAKEPPGARGLVELVKIRPELERRLLDFAKELPVPKLGAWAPAAFGNVFKESAVLRDYQGLLKSWSEQTDSTTLKAAAGAISKMGDK